MSRPLLEASERIEIFPFNQIGTTSEREETTRIQHGSNIPVSKLEKRADLMISTLRKTVEAMGGSLSLVAEFPDRDPVVLSGISEDKQDAKPRAKKRRALAHA